MFFFGFHQTPRKSCYITTNFYISTFISLTFNILSMLRNPFVPFKIWLHLLSQSSSNPQLKFFVTGLHPEASQNSFFVWGSWTELLGEIAGIHDDDLGWDPLRGGGNVWGPYRFSSTFRAHLHMSPLSHRHHHLRCCHAITRHQDTFDRLTSSLKSKVSKGVAGWVWVGKVQNDMMREKRWMNVASKLRVFFHDKKNPPRTHK